MGYLEGGWEFVYAAYALSAVAFVGYGISVFLRFRAERARARREAPGAPEVSS